MDIAAFLSPVPVTDLGKQIIDALLPSGGSTPFTEALSVFSVSMLAVATGMVAWHSLVGIVSSAHTGKFMGGKWHAIWGPIRISLGVAMLVPAINGATFAQVIVQEIAYMSNAMAAKVWDAYATKIVTDKSSMPVMTDLGGFELAIAIERKEFCVAGLTALMTADGVQKTADGGYLVPLPTMAEMRGYGGQHIAVWPAAAKEVVKTDGSHWAVWDFGSACGTIELPLKVDASENQVGVQAWQASQIQNVTNAINDVTNKKIATTFVKSIIAVGEPLTPGDVIATAVRSMVDVVSANFDQAQRAAASEYAKANYANTATNLQEKIHEEGWISAGLYWRQLSLMVQTYADAAPSRVIVTDGSTADLPSASTQEMKQYYYYARKFNEDLLATFPNPSSPELNAVATAVNEKSQYSVSNSGGVRSPEQDSWLVRTGLAWVTEKAHGLTEGIVGNLGRHPEDPIGNMSDIGHTILIYATPLSIPIAAIATAIGHVASGLGTVIFTGFEFIAGIGVAYAYVIPMLPLYYVIMLAIGWVTMMVESIIAVVVWAFLWVRMDGDELVDNPQRAGFLVLFNLFLRPTMGILGLIAGMTMMSIVLWLFNKLVVVGIFASQAAASMALLGSLATIAGTFYIHWQIITRMLALTTDIPDWVTRWIGVPGGGANDSHHAGAAVGAAVGAAMGSGRHGNVGRIASAKPKEKVQLEPSGSAKDGRDKGGSSDARAPRGDGD